MQHATRAYILKPAKHGETIIPTDRTIRYEVGANAQAACSLIYGGLIKQCKTNRWCRISEVLCEQADSMTGRYVILA